MNKEIRTATLLVSLPIELLDRVLRILAKGDISLEKFVSNALSNLVIKIEDKEMDKDN